MSGYTDDVTMIEGIESFAVDFLRNHLRLKSLRKKSETSWIDDWWKGHYVPKWVIATLTSLDNDRGLTWDV